MESTMCEKTGNMIFSWQCISHRLQCIFVNFKSLIFHDKFLSRLNCVEKETM